MRKILSLLVLALAAPAGSSLAQGTGPWAPHQNLLIVRAYTSSFGPDAEEYNRFAALTPEYIEIDYSDTRGISARRRVLKADSRSARRYLIGFDPSVPLTVPGTTSLGLSSDALQDLRSTGTARVALVYDTKLSSIDGTLTVTERDIKVPVLVENQLVQVAALRAKGTFGSGTRTGSGDFYFLDDINQPMLIQYDIRFSWEKQPRTVRTVRISAGQSQQTAMAKTLATVRKLDLYGLHFDFDKATLQARSAPLLSDIAQTLKLNPNWTLEIRGHTDSIGAPAYNLKLSQQRAESVRQALITQYGIQPSRLSAVGVGQNEPKGSNDTLQGRAVNRRVELARTDR
jgi:outer membrane protein OmpA-like peptidoglycan-associated protein